MKPVRRLALAKETLTELTTPELGAVAGGQPSGDKCPSQYCPTAGLQCFLSLHDLCPSSENLC